METTRTPGRTETSYPASFAGNGCVGLGEVCCRPVLCKKPPREEASQKYEEMNFKLNSDRVPVESFG